MTLYTVKYYEMVPRETVVNAESETDAATKIHLRLVRCEVPHKLLEVLPI